MAKSTDAELELRIAILYKMIVRGRTRANILRFTADEWQIEGRQTDTYLALVRDKIKEVYGQAYKESILSNHLAQLDDLYERNYSTGDFKECRGIIDSRSKLLGLNEAIKIDSTTTVRVVTPLSFFTTDDKDK